jgi:hypothetical protein
MHKRERSPCRNPPCTIISTRPTDTFSPPVYTVLQGAVVIMTNEDWVKKLLKLCEQKYGPDVPTMRQLRRRLEAIRQSEPSAMQQFVTGTRNAADR